MTKVRCAIYTRKSSEEGLEQDFNSLHAQREACAAYVLSQASEGWNLLPDEYDDGGISGGTLERPGLQRLLTDIAMGRIDIVVVYKVDRLTRSLLDFSRPVEAFDKAGTSFVSVTQSFNTTTSMGRLTLNMLLSFAQFEREVTAERMEHHLCQAIERGVLVDLRYDDDVRARTFAPYVVYPTSTGKVCVFGMQIADPADASDRSDPHNFEVGRIRDVALSATRFERDPHFDLSSARYRNRVCPI